MWVINHEDFSRHQETEGEEHTPDQVVCENKAEAQVETNVGVGKVGGLR